MKHTWKKAAAALLALTMLTGAAPSIAPAQDLLNGAVLTAHAVEAVASGECGENVTWTLDDEGTLTISGEGAMQDYWGHSAIASQVKKIVIENGVTSIGAVAFDRCKALQSVSIPESVKQIGDYAFQECSFLTEVSMKEGLESIGKNAFYDCSALQSVSIPTGVTSIGDCAFQNCSALRSVSIPESVTSIGQYAFYGAGLTSVTIPGSVQNPGAYAFAECADLELVIIQDGVSALSRTMFYSCKNLRSVVIENASVVAVDQSTFSGIIGTTYDAETDLAIYVPDELVEDYKNAESWSIYYKDAIRSSKVDEWPCGSGNTLMKCKAVLNVAGTLTFSGEGTFNPVLMTSSEIKKVVIKEGLTGFSSAFQGYNALETVVFPSTLDSISDFALYNCQMLRSVIIPKGVNSIGMCAFYNCGNLQSVSIPEGVTSIGDSAFGYCGNLKSVSIQKGLETIGPAAFIQCKNLKSVSIPEGVTSIGQAAFMECKNLKSVSIPKGVTSIDSMTFNNCTNLQSVSIPESVTSIGPYAFGFCTELESLSIPENVNSIGDQALFGCTGLQTVTVNAAEPPELGDRALSYRNESDEIIPLDAEIVVPFESVGKYQQADGWKDMQLASKIPDTGISQCYRQTAENDGTFYTRFVFAVPEEGFKDADSVLYTVTDGRNGKEYTFTSTYYYTGMTTNNVHYTPEDGSALFVVTVSSGSDISDQLTCTLAFD
ncbi:MAG: leucine-rich repeat domain-containing protein [Oscillospiraceae bacterium]|nr:leucine-rich repeat domain-containing protein [Oscillospiraceae bacterium]